VSQTGLYYYGARYYSAWLGRFVSVDPLQHKYPYYTPYQYAGNKPVTYIDLDGLEEMQIPVNDTTPDIQNRDVSNISKISDQFKDNLSSIIEVENNLLNQTKGAFIIGPDADKAVEEMNKLTNLTIVRDPKTGKLSSIGARETTIDKLLYSAINDPIINTNLETTKENFYIAKDDGLKHPIIVGAYEGSEISYDGENKEVVRTKQLINIEQAEKIENAGGTTVGESTIHEFIESYIGGTIDPGGDYNSGYSNSHNLTIGFTPAFDNSGKMVKKRDRSGRLIGLGVSVGEDNKYVELINLQR